MKLALHYKNKQEKILCIIMNNALLLDSYIKDVCKKASQRPAALSRLPNYLGPEERKLIFNSVIKSHFRYCLLVWN